MPASALGTATFLTMVPRPQGPAQKIALESKAGVAGNAAWQTGVRSEPQQIETLRDVTDWAAAVALCATYESAIGSVLTVTYAGVLQGFTALILDVKCSPEKILKGMGGLTPNGTAQVRATWTIETR
jgi:hypothetical protein